MTDDQAIEAYRRWSAGVCPCCGRRAAADACGVCGAQAAQLPNGVVICGHCAGLGHDAEVLGVDPSRYLGDGIARGRQLAAAAARV